MTYADRGIMPCRISWACREARTDTLPIGSKRASRRVVGILRGVGDWRQGWHVAYELRNVTQSQENGPSSSGETREGFARWVRRSAGVVRHFVRARIDPGRGRFGRETHNAGCDAFRKEPSQERRFRYVSGVMCCPYRLLFHNCERLRFLHSEWGYLAHETGIEFFVFFTKPRNVLRVRLST